MDWRQYDSAIGRFVSIDYMAEYMPEFTPYHFSYNSPVEFNDPSGLCPECTDIKDPVAGQTFIDSNGATNIYTPNEDGNGGTWITQIETVVIKADAPKKSESVGQPEGWTSAIPIYGSARSSIDHFQNGNYVEGSLYAALAISDVFLVKSLVVGGAKLGMSMLAKSSTGLADDVVVKGGNVIIKRSVGAAPKGFSTVLQSGGHTLNKTTLKALGMTKEEGKIAIEALKKDLGLAPNFHGKIMGNGDILNPHTREVLGNLFDYLY